MDFCDNDDAVFVVFGLLNCNALDFQDDDSDGEIVGQNALYRSLNLSSYILKSCIASMFLVC